MQPNSAIPQGATNSTTEAALGSAASNQTLRNTYRLLSLTLGFSAITASVTAALALPHPGLLITLGGYFALLFITVKTRNSGWGLVSVFALTGFMGYTIGPVLSAYLALANGATLVATAAGATAIAFLALSAYARSDSAIDVRRYGGFLVAGVLVAFCLGLAAIFFELSALSVAVSGLFVLLMSGLIVYETQNIVRGGETNYIMATVTLFVSIYNLFTSLLHLLGFIGGDEA
jgi:modulator of FtsH protease